ncbi:CHAD domain-containing protein [Streptomyces luteireticuli]|uniref:CHAD domain-containing protein n=1 Tax=Streptomyces luteireticuli TaxID=173858 RepID=A0ABN0YWI9_9ACTN
MAQRHRDPLLTGADPSAAGEALARYLHQQSTEFLRGLRLHADGGEAAEAARLLRSAARRIAGALEVYRPLTDTGWADALHAELAWVTDTLGREYVCEARLARLRGALHRLSGEPSVGGARAGALLERQLTLARNRAHSAALQALGSARFHAVADTVALLSADPPLDPSAPETLSLLAERTHRRLLDAVGVLPLTVAGLPYNAEALVRSLEPDGLQDGPWHRVRSLVRLRRYAQEVLDEQHRTEAEPALSVRLSVACQALDRHRDAAGAAAAAAAAARTPRIAPATAYALGVLHADQRHEVEAARFAFGRAWQRPS